MRFLLDLLGITFSCKHYANSCERKCKYIAILIYTITTTNCTLANAHVGIDDYNTGLTLLTMSTITTAISLIIITSFIMVRKIYKQRLKNMSIIVPNHIGSIMHVKKLENALHFLYVVKNSNLRKYAIALCAHDARVLITNVTDNSLMWRHIKIDNSLVNTVTLSGVASLIQLIPAWVWYLLGTHIGLFEAVTSNAYITSIICSITATFTMFKVIKDGGWHAFVEVILPYKRKPQTDYHYDTEHFKKWITEATDDQGSTLGEPRLYNDIIKISEEQYCVWCALQIAGVIGANMIISNMDTSYIILGKMWLVTMCKKYAQIPGLTPDNDVATMLDSLVSNTGGNVPTSDKREIFVQAIKKLEQKLCCEAMIDEKPVSFRHYLTSIAENNKNYVHDNEYFDIAKVKNKKQWPYMERKASRPIFNKVLDNTGSRV